MAETSNTNTAPVASVHREVKIGKTIYRLTSKYEGEKDLDATLQRLAVKQAANLREGG